jgi:hypothetical protein
MNPIIAIFEIITRKLVIGYRYFGVSLYAKGRYLPTGSLNLNVQHI